MTQVLAGRRSDPYRKFMFRVVIKDLNDMGFTEVQGLRSEVPVLEVEEGGNQVPYKFPDRKVNFGNILLAQGLGRRDDMTVWFEDHLKWVRESKAIYRPMMIQLLNKKRQPVYAWEVFNSWPTILEIDGLDSNSDDVVIKRAEIANWGFAVRNPQALMLSGGPETWFQQQAQTAFA